MFSQTLKQKESVLLRQLLILHLHDHLRLCSLKGIILMLLLIWQSYLCHELIQMTVTELYMPTRKVLPVFTHYSYSTASMMTLTRVREVVTRYIKEGELVSPSNSR